MILASLLAALPLFSSASDIHTFDAPIDAISVSFATQDASAEVRYKTPDGWSEWESLVVESEQDPLTRESNLVMFDEPARQIDIRGDIAELHPIAISAAPVRYTIAALTDPGVPRILSRNEWGADDSLLYHAGDRTADETGGSGDNGPVTNQRVIDCEQAQTDYPSEFKVKKTVKTQDGNELRWAFQYSPSVKVIAVHHTAVKVTGDKRSGAERVRALYAYHADNRGWGDVGYHFLVDEDGKIYEGKAGGEYVVGGHAYCNNIGTVGVSLLGNFEEEQPTQKQLKALQWLLTDLAETYDIDLDNNVKFHGKTMPPVVGHRDLVSTECPGFYLYGALDQIRKNAASGDVDAAVTLPKLPGAVSKERASARAVTRKPTVNSGVPRRVQRILDSQASNQLRRKIGSNSGKEIEDGTAARRAARLSGASSKRSVRSVARSSVSRSSRPTVSKASSSRSSRTSTSTRASSPDIRIHLSRQENGAISCDAYDLATLRTKYRGTVTCTVINNKATLINTLSLEDYLIGLAEEPDTEPYEKQRAFAIAARTYAAHYMQEKYRKFPGMPYDGDDSPARFQMYGGIAFEKANPRWVEAVKDTENIVLKKDDQIIRPAYFSSDDGRTRTPKEAGWGASFPFAEIFTSKDDPWCAGMPMNGHGVGMSGCGAEGQAHDGKTGEEILEYYYPGTELESVR